MTGYRTLKRDSARIKFDFVSASPAELLKETQITLDRALRRIEDGRHREGYYDVVRAWVYVTEARGRGMQLYLFDPAECGDCAVHPE